MLLALAGVIWPVAHVGNVAWLAVSVNVLLVIALVPLALTDLRSPAAR